MNLEKIVLFFHNFFIFNILHFISALFIPNINEFKVLNRVDIIICSDSNLLVNLVKTTASFQTTFFAFNSCQPCVSENNFKLQSSTVMAWLMSPDESVEKAVQIVQSCIIKQGLFYAENLSNNHPVYHFVFAPMSNSCSHIFMLQLLEKKIGHLLTHPQEFFFCHFPPNPTMEPHQCFEIYNIKSKVIIVQTIPIDKAITEISIRRLDFAQAPIPAVAADLPGFAKKFKPRLKPEDPLEFLDMSNVNIYRYLRDALNFMEVAIRTNESLTRSPVDAFLQNSGLVASMFSEESDFSIGQYEFVPYRLGGRYGVRYLHAAITTRNGLAIFVQPSNLGAVYTYARPFNLSVWKCCSATVALILISLIIYFRYIPCLAKSVSLCKAAWYTIGILTLKGNEYHTVTSISIKILLLSSLMSVIILQSVYTSILTSLWTIEYDPISDFRQLISAGYKFVVNENTQVLKPLVAQYTDKKSLEVTVETAFPEVLRSRTVLITTLSEFHTFLPPIYKEDFLCDKLSFLAISSIPIKDAHLVRQGTPLKNAFNIKILQMFQTGIERRTRKDFIEQSHLLCPTDEPITFHSLAMENINFPFSILFLLIGISFAILLIERFQKSHK